MNHSPAVGLPTYPSLQEPQCARCNHTSICGVHPLVMSNTMSAPMLSMMSAQTKSTPPTQVFLTSALAIFYDSIRFLGLHHLWFSAWRLIPDARNSDLEKAPTSCRSHWTKTVRKMNRVWALIIAASTLIITLSVAFLQIDNILNHIYPRTFAIAAFLLSSASLAASFIFVANRASLDSIEKFRQWEIASQNQKGLSSVDFWACLSLPLTSLVWSICFCLVTLFSLGWVDQGAQTIPAYTSEVDLALSTTLISVAVLCLAIQFYRVRNFLAKGSTFNILSESRTKK